MTILNKAIHSILIITFSLMSSACTASESEGCSFSKDAINLKQYKNNKSLKFQHWDSQSNSLQAITTEGDVLSVKHWACHHYGLEATLYTGPYAELDDYSISKQLKKLADIVLSPKDYELFAGNLQQMKLTIPDEGVTKQLQNHPYQEFSFQYQIVSEGLLVSIRRIGE